MSDQAINPSAFDLTDLTALPDQVTGTATKTFSAAGRDWTITIRTNVTANPENMYTLMRLLTDPGKMPRTIVLPGIEPFVLRDKKYVGMLSVMAGVSVEPAWNGLDGVDRWAYFARKVGGPAIDEILAWMLVTSGVGSKPNEDGTITNEEADAAGEVTAQAG